MATTDLALPDILSTAANRVDRISEQLHSVAVATQIAAAHVMLGWSGPRTGIYAAACVKVARELGIEAGMARELADILRRAAKSAAERIYWEAKAAEAARQAEATRAAAAAKARAKPGGSR